jgi:hypothetical protein
LLAGICALGSWTLAARGADLPTPTEALWALTYRLFLVAWVRADMRSHDFTAPYEFDAFLFFAWPVALPYYFCKTRGPRGLFAAIGVFLLIAVPDAVWSFVHVFTAMR